MQYQDYYATLGVQRNANADEIKKAYRKLSKEFHPDRNKSKGAEEKFKKVNEAYEVLKDTKKRAHYDALGNGFQAGEPFRPPSGFQGWQNVDFDFGGGGAGGPIGGFSDFFETFFRGPPQGEPDPYERFRPKGGANAPRKKPGRDIETEISISLDEAFTGTQRTLDLGRTSRSFDGGRRADARTLTVRIPPGATQGTRIRLKQKGEESPFGGPRGDLLIQVRLKPHPRFEVSGHDLTTKLPISPWEAALGAKVPLQTLDGDVALTIPPGSQAGRKMRLRGKGIPRKGKDAGNLEVELQIVLPTELSEEEKRLFEELRLNSRFDPRA